MGVSFGFYDLNHRLESMMDLVGQNATDQAEIETWLTRLAAIDSALTSSTSDTDEHGAIKKVDEVEFYPVGGEDGTGSSTLGLIDQGRTLIARIARAMGVSDYLPQGDYFGAQKPNGFTISLG